jgi:APA family basic amino acid/polyamine antiporter
MSHSDHYLLFKKKKAKKSPKGGFKQTYGLGALILMGFGNTIGSGVFTLTGVGSKAAGAAVFLSFIISGFIALLTALVYAEFSALIPKSGSSYIYTYTVFG